MIARRVGCASAFSISLASSLFMHNSDIPIKHFSNLSPMAGEAQPCACQVGKTRTRNPSAYSPLIHCSWSNRIHSFGGLSSKLHRSIHTPASSVKSEMLAHHPQCWFFVQVDHRQLDRLSLPLCVNMIETEGCQKRIAVRTYAMHGFRSREGLSKQRGREREGGRVKKGLPRNSRLRRAVP